MAASLLQNPTPPSSRPTSRQRHHDRRPSEKSQRYERELRRLQSEQRHGEQQQQQQQQQGRMPSPRQKTRGWQQPTPPDTPGSSLASLTAPLEDHTRSLPMERTSSGNSIVADQNYEPRHNYTLTCSDADAARSVQYSTKSPKSDEKFVRYFRKLIESHDELDDNALDSILIGADTVFFHGALSGRVRWEWSHPSQSRYESELIGSTALRPATSPALKGGYETLIVLSAPILRHNSRRFDRRLLLSAFLHELVHCYLFIQCGFLARDQGGHTEGFHIIAGVIDDWVAGCGVVLKLCNMKANLNHFRVDRPVVDATRMPGGRFLSPGAFLRDRDGANVGWQHRHEGCSHSPGDRSHEETGILWQAREEGWR